MRTERGWRLWLLLNVCWHLGFPQQTAQMRLRTNDGANWSWKSRKVPSTLTHIPAMKKVTNRPVYTCVIGACGIKLLEKQKGSFALALAVLKWQRNRKMSALAYRISTILFQSNFTNDSVVLFIISTILSLRLSKVVAWEVSIIQFSASLQ